MLSEKENGQRSVGEGNEYVGTGKVTEPCGSEKSRIWYISAHTSDDHSTWTGSV